MTYPRTDAAGRKILRLSWSKLKEFELCQQRSWQKAQPGFQRPLMDGRNFLSGTLGDRALRKFLELPEGTHERGMMERFVDELWDEHAERSTEYKIKWRGDPREDRDRVRELAKTAVRNVEPFVFKRVLPKDFQPELRFVVPLTIPDLLGSPRTIHLVGGIDIAVRELAPDTPPAERAVELFDLKVTLDDSYVSGDIQAQLIFYQICWHLLVHTPYDRIKCAYLTPAATRQYRPLEITAEDRHYLGTRILKVAHGIWREDKALVEDTNVCWNCEAHHVCERWNRPPIIDGRHMRVPFTR